MIDREKTLILNVTWEDKMKPRLSSPMNTKDYLETLWKNPWAWQWELLKSPHWNLFTLMWLLTGDEKAHTHSLRFRYVFFPQRSPQSSQEWQKLEGFPVEDQGQSWILKSSFWSSLSPKIKPSLILHLLFFEMKRARYLLRIPRWKFSKVRKGRIYSIILWTLLKHTCSNATHDDDDDEKSLFHMLVETLKCLHEHIRMSPNRTEIKKVTSL